MAQTNPLAEQLFGNQQQSMGAMQAMASGIQEGLQGLVDGVGKAYDLAQSSPALNHMASMGSHEIAAALFGPTGSGFVMYPRGDRDDHGLQGPGQAQEQGHGQEPQQEQQLERGRSM